MSNSSADPWQPDNPEGLARDFSRLGRIGFLIQLALLFIPVGRQVMGPAGLGA